MRTVFENLKKELEKSGYPMRMHLSGRMQMEEPEADLLRSRRLAAAPPKEGEPYLAVASDTVIRDGGKWRQASRLMLFRIPDVLRLSIPDEVREFVDDCLSRMFHVYDQDRLFQGCAVLSDLSLTMADRAIDIFREFPKKRREAVSGVLENCLPEPVVPASMEEVLSALDIGLDGYSLRKGVYEVLGEDRWPEPIYCYEDDHVMEDTLSSLESEFCRSAEGEGRYPAGADELAALFLLFERISLYRNLEDIGGEIRRGIRYAEEMEGVTAFKKYLAPEKMPSCSITADKKGEGK